MEGQVDHEQVYTSRVVKVDSLATWDLSVAEATNQGSLIVVHFTASWCMPSVAMNPLFQELASSYPDVLFLTVDVDEVKEVATRLDIKAMPTFVVMKEGKQVDKVVGANPEEIRKRICGHVQSCVLDESWLEEKGFSDKRGGMLVAIFDDCLHMTSGKVENSTKVGTVTQILSHQPAKGFSFVDHFETNYNGYS